MLPITIRHRHTFREDRELVGDSLDRSEIWDRLRVQSSGSFALASTPAAIEAEADSRPEIGDRMRALVEELGAGEQLLVASYGVGTALAEVWLRRVLPRSRLILTESAPQTQQRLAVLLPDTRVVAHDLGRDRPLDADRHVFHRIDSEFDDREWKAILERFRGERIILLATELLSLRSGCRETANLLKPSASRAGWIRNRGAFERLWSSTHHGTPRRFSDLHGWVLEPLE